MSRTKIDNVTKNGRYWHGEFMIDGARIRFSTRKENRKDAVRVVRVRKREELDRRRNVGGAPPDVTFDVAAGMYWEALGEVRKDEDVGSQSKSGGRSQLKRAVHAVGPDTPCRRIDTAFMWELRARLAAEKPRDGLGRARDVEGTLSASHVNKILCTVLSVLRVAETTLRTTFPDMPDPEVEDIYLKTQGRSRYLKDTEEPRLKACCDEDLWDMIAFDLETGLRARELAGLKWDEIDWGEESIMPSVKGEGREERRHTIYLSETALAILARRLASGVDDVNVFTLRAERTYWIDGRLVEMGDPFPANYPSMRTRFVRAVREAGLGKKLILHDVRRAAARRIFFEAGIEIAQAFLGHTYRHTTLLYLCLSEEDTRAAIRHRERRMATRRAEIAAAVEAGAPVPEIDDRRVQILRGEFARTERLAAARASGAAA